jgi:hypothetical protein
MDDSSQRNSLASPVVLAAPAPPASARKATCERLFHHILAFDRFQLIAHREGLPAEQATEWRELGFMAGEKTSRCARQSLKRNRPLTLSAPRRQAAVIDLCFHGNVDLSPISTRPIDKGLNNAADLPADLRPTRLIRTLLCAAVAAGDGG